MKEKLIFFIGNEEFEYTVEKKNDKYVGRTTFDARLNCEAKTLLEVEEIVKNRIAQLTTSGK